MATTIAPKQPAPQRDPGKVADFILFSQREFLLNLSKDLSRGNVSFAQFYLLSYLSTSRELTMTDIARKMGHSTAAATGLVDRLEKLGYVERMHAADDRRKVMVRITAKGMELVAKLRSTLQNRVAEAMEESSAQDVDTFVQNYRGRDDSSSD
jgi:DNA-binding MarR family transcriptional regulator